MASQNQEDWNSIFSGAELKDLLKAFDLPCSFPTKNVAIDRLKASFITLDAAKEKLNKATQPLRTRLLLYGFLLQPLEMKRSEAYYMV
jgi:hypothetical protein